MPMRVYTKPTRCRPTRAYANAYATYAVCIAYAWGIICLVEFPLYLFFWILKKTLLETRNSFIEYDILAILDISARIEQTIHKRSATRVDAGK